MSMRTDEQPNAHTSSRRSAGQRCVENHHNRTQRLFGTCSPLISSTCVVDSRYRIPNQCPQHDPWITRYHLAVLTDRRTSAGH
jgi:hypothetical protein